MGRGVAAGSGRTLLLAALTAFVLVLLVRAWVVEPVRVVSDSMRPTLDPGQRVVMWKAPAFAALHRDDVVGFRQGDRLLIKRVVALGGDRVAIRDGRLVVNGQRVSEPWSDPKLIDSVFFGPVDVPAGMVFVMGDNRGPSRDSRTFGPVPLGDVEGKIVATVWPPAAMSAQEER